MFQDNQPEQSVQEQAPAETPAQPEPPKQPEKPVKPAAVPVKTMQEEKMWAAIGYVAFLGVVTLAMQPKSDFCKKHASQGLVIFAVWFTALILMAGPSVVSIVGLVLLLAMTGLAVLGIMKSVQSYEFNVPILSDIAKKVPINSIIGSMTGKTVETPEATSEQPAQEKPAVKEPEQEVEQPESSAEKPETPAETTSTPPSQDEEPPKTEV